MGTGQPTLIEGLDGTEVVPDDFVVVGISIGGTWKEPIREHNKNF